MMERYFSETPAARVLRERREQNAALRYQRAHGFTRSRQGVVERAKESWLDWLKIFGRDPKRAARKRRKLVRQQHLRRLNRDPKYAARCEKRRRDYEWCLMNDPARAYRLARAMA